MYRKLLFVVAWLAIIILSVYVSLAGTNYDLVLTDRLLLLTFLQNSFGVFGLGLLSFQILIGAYMDRLQKYFGSWILGFHKLHGILVYVIILSHPILYLFIRTKSGIAFDPFFVFIDACLYCNSRYELFISFGRIAVILVTVAVFVARLRMVSFCKKYWRRYHILNYPAFLLIIAHAGYMGGVVRGSIYSVYLSICLLMFVSSVSHRLKTSNWKKELENILDQ